MLINDLNFLFLEEQLEPEDMTDEAEEAYYRIKTALKGPQPQANNSDSNVICATCGESFRSKYCEGCHLKLKLLPCYPPSSLCIERRKLHA